MRPRQRIQHRTIAVLLGAAIMLTASAGTSAASAPPPGDTVDIQSLYPGPDARGLYLEGNNWVTGTPSRSVLWFEPRIRGYFDQHNWGPEDPQADCETDRFRWKSGELRYLWTDTECDGQDIRTRYRPAVVYAPATWDPSVEWSRCGRSTVTHTDHGVVVRSGTTVWCSRVVGIVELQPGRPVVQIDVRLTTIWDGEDVGTATQWIETLYLDPEFGLARHAGGNLNGDFNWDVWFTHWAPLPAGESS